MALTASLGTRRASRLVVKREVAPRIAPAKRSNAKHNELPTIELAIRFAAWACAQATFPTPTEIQDRWGVCAATAWRWRGALARAYNFTPPPIEKGMGQGGVR